MTGFITVMESWLSVKDNQHVKHGLVVITCIFFSSRPSFRNHFVVCIYLVPCKLLEMNHKNVSFTFSFNICIWRHAVDCMHLWMSHMFICLVKKSQEVEQILLSRIGSVIRFGCTLTDKDIITLLLDEVMISGWTF